MGFLRRLLVRHADFATPRQVREVRDMIADLMVQNLELTYALDVERTAHVTLRREVCGTCLTGISETYQLLADRAVAAYAATSRVDEELDQIVEGDL